MTGWDNGFYVYGGGAGPGGEHIQSKLFTSGLDP